MSVTTFTRSVRIERPASEVFAWHERPGAFARLAPPWRKLELIAHEGGIRDGATVAVLAKIGCWWTRWDVEHRDYVEGVQFRDVQVRGPFAHWEHLHHIEPADGGRACVLTDTVRYRLPFGGLGKLLGDGFVKAELSRLFNYRHALTKADIEGASRYISVRPMTFLIAGASGLIGRALTAFLHTQGHTVVRLVRRGTSGASEVFWDPASGKLDPQALRGVDVVINLAGAGVADARWSPARKELIKRSRVDATRTLVSALTAVKNERQRPFVFICASGVGYYGDRGNTVLDETGSAADGGFLAGVCAEWEREALAAEELGVRVVRMRTGVVLTPSGGALARLLPVFRSGLGGPMGGGKMWMSWIALDDMVAAIYHAVLDRRCDGAVNFATPHPVTNAEFVRTLARVLRRPAVLPVPAVALRAMFGEMAEETLLASSRVKPAKLQEAGYVFRHARMEDALRHLLGREPRRTKHHRRR